MRIASQSQNSKSGFTLVDSAIALVLMGCVLCLLIPVFAHGTSAADAVARRDAQALCSICYEAQRAGVNFVVGNDVDSTLQNLLSGGQTSSGRTFKAAGMTIDEATAAARYLHVDNGNLVVDLVSGS